MRRVLVLAALPLLTSCGGTQPLSGGPGGLQGKVMRGPITPTCTQGRSCSEPARGVTLGFSKGGSLVAHVKTDDGGTYRVTLPPGRYFVRAVQPVHPQQVSVGRGAFRRVDFAIDTKIR